MWKINTLPAALTAVLLLGIGLYIIFDWQDVRQLKPNDVGDFFSGTAATIALIWVIGGYYQQSLELRENTSALKAQQKELEAQVANMRAMADFAAEQVKAMQQFAMSAAEQAYAMRTLAHATEKQVHHDRDLASAAKEQARATDKLAHAIEQIRYKI